MVTTWAVVIWHMATHGRHIAGTLQAHDTQQHVTAVALATAALESVST